MTTEKAAPTATTEHSLLPWRRARRGLWIETGAGALIAHAASAIERRQETAYVDAATEANIEFICRAANNHESLLAALKELLGVTSQPVIDRAAVDAAQHEAYLAIAKAEAK